MRVLWDYLVLDQPVRPMDAIVAIGSNALRVAERAAELYRDGYGAYVICSGGTSPASVLDRPEAHVFAEMVSARGVPTDRILVEDSSSNSLENAQFLKVFLERRGIEFSSFLLVQKPYMERRAYATFTHVWPEKEYVVTSPRVSFEKYTKTIESTERLAHLLLENVERIKTYSRRGDIAPQEVPEQVSVACDALRKAR